MKNAVPSWKWASVKSKFLIVEDGVLIMVEQREALEETIVTK